MPDKSAIIQELYDRIGTMAPDKAAVVQELANRYGVGANAGAQMQSDALRQVPAGLRGLTPDELAQRVDTSNPLSPIQSMSVADSLNNSYRAGATSMIDGSAQIANAHTGRDLAGGAHQVIGGATQIVSQPAIAAGLATAPVATLAGLGVGSLAQHGATSGLRAAGVPQEYANLAGDVAGFAGGAKAGHTVSNAAESVGDLYKVLSDYTPAGERGVFDLPSKVSSAAGSAMQGIGNLPRRLAPIKNNLDPSEAAAVQYGRDNGVHMRTSVQTGSKVAGGTEKILEHVPFGAAGIAEHSRNLERSTLADAGNREVSGLNPDGSNVPKPLDVGEAIQQTALQNEQKHNSTASDAYSMLRSIEAQPQFRAEVQTGTKRVADPSQVDEAGNPTFKTVPVLENVQLPVDYRQIKAAVKPVLAEVLRPMPIAQQQMSVGIKALQNVMDAPDFVPASIADQDLGALKSILRDSTQTRSVAHAKFAADLLSKAVDAAVERAGPDAVEALKRGRDATVAKYKAQDFQKAIGFKNVGTGSVEPGEPVAIVNKLAAEGDRNIRLLRQVAQHAPEHIPGLAQSVVQDLVEHVTADAGMDKAKTALRRYTDLGAETRKILFGAQDANLKNFFVLAKRLADNPNPSGTGPAIAIMKVGGMMLTSPVRAAVGLIGSKHLARMLFNPETSRLMQTALRMPAESKGAGLLGKQLTDAAIAAGAPAPGGSAAPAASAIDPAAADTFVTVPGEPHNAYRAQYKVVERSTLQASHSGKTFQPNPKFELNNDRDYNNAVNQGTVLGWSSRGEFDPKNLVNDNPDAVNGPMVTDSKGNVLGGNGRAMILDRVFADPSHPGIAAYRALLEKKAAQFGIDPASFAGMKEPVLVREVADSEFAGRSKQDAITDFNKKGTKELTPSEQAIADSKRVSESTLEHVAAQLDKHGADATIAEALEGQHGKDVLNRLVTDGVITKQERGKLENDEGLTPDGKDRISALIAGRFFKNAQQLDTISASIRNKVTRMAAPLAQVEGRGEWNLTPDVQQAVDILHQMQALKIKNVDDFIEQDGLFGEQKYSAKARDLARAIHTLHPVELTAAARQYAEDSGFASGGDNMFGATPTAESSFADALGPDAITKALEARKEKKNALAPAAAAGGKKNKLAL